MLYNEIQHPNKIKHIQLTNINSISDCQIIWCINDYQRCDNKFNILNKEIKILQLYFANLMNYYMKVIYEIYEQSSKFSEYVNEISRILTFIEYSYATQRINSWWI